MKKHRIWYLISLLFSVLLYILSNSQAALVLVAGLCVAVPCFGILQMLAMKDAKVGCQIHELGMVGKDQEVVFTLSRRNRLPIGGIRLTLEMENVLYGETKRSLIRLQPAEKTKQNFRYSFIPEHCGNLKLRICQVDYPDLLGLFCRREHPEIQMEMLVYPKEANLHLLLDKRPEAETFGELYDPGRKGQDISEVSGLRNYVEGDSWGSIHWKLSSKVDELIVREFGYPSNYSTVILCDLMKKTETEAVPQAQNDAVLAYTFSFCMKMLELNLEHHVVQISNGECQRIPVDTMENRDEMMLQFLCSPMEEEKSTADSLQYVLRSNLVNEYTKMIYVTSAFDEDSVRQLARKMDLTVICLHTATTSSYTEEQGYSVLRIPVENYEKTPYQIMI